MQLINTLFCGVQLASVKCESAADGGCLFAVKLIFQTAPRPSYFFPPHHFLPWGDTQGAQWEISQVCGDDEEDRDKRGHGQSRPDWSFLFAKKLLDFAFDIFFFVFFI